MIERSKGGTLGPQRATTHLASVRASGGEKFGFRYFIGMGIGPVTSVAIESRSISS